jgi:hypothetical protein
MGLHLLHLDLQRRLRRLLLQRRCLWCKGSR